MLVGVVVAAVAVVLWRSYLAEASQR